MDRIDHDSQVFARGQLIEQRPVVNPMQRFVGFHQPLPEGEGIGFHQFSARLSANFPARGATGNPLS